MLELGTLEISSVQNSAANFEPQEEMMEMTLRWISDERWVEVAQDRFQCPAVVLPGVKWIVAFFHPKITDTLREDQYTFLILFGAIILRMGNFLPKSCREN